MLNVSPYAWAIDGLLESIRVKRERTEGCHDLLPFLPRVAAGKESRMGTGGQRSLRKKLQGGFLHWTKSLYSLTSSCISSLSLFGWLFALLLLE